MIDLIELAWAAGFFDGEGTFNAYEDSREGNFNLGIQITLPQIHEEPLERFRAVTKVGKIYGPYDRGNKPIYWYKTNGFETVQHVAASLWFKLGTPKREQAHDALSRYVTHYEPRRLPTHGTTNMYKVWKCRCNLCVTANRTYHREWARKRKQKV